jgi:hypothetical protein
MVEEDRAFLESAESAASAASSGVERAAAHATVTAGAAARVERSAARGPKSEKTTEAPPPIASKSIKPKKAQRELPAPAPERIVEVRRAEAVQPERRGFFDRLFEKHD